MAQQQGTPGRCRAHGAPGGNGLIHAGRRYGRRRLLGSHLCERLIERDDEVVCLDNFLTGSPENVAHLFGRDGFRLVRTDVTAYIHIVGPVDIVLIFASPASPVDYLRVPIETLKVGSIGTLHALGLAKKKGARLVLASTSEVYGDPEVYPQPETYWGHVSPVGPRGVYDEAKRFAEVGAGDDQLARQQRAPTRRLTLVSGPRRCSAGPRG